jgi:hypothetical protein
MKREEGRKWEKEFSVLKEEQKGGGRILDL